MAIVPIGTIFLYGYLRFSRCERCLCNLWKHLSVLKKDFSEVHEHCKDIGRNIPKNVEIFLCQESDPHPCRDPLTHHSQYMMFVKTVFMDVMS